VDALFETVSGFTTTGASILTQIEGLPFGVLFWRSFTHWIGGMGILVFTLAILPSMDAGAFRILKAEAPGPITEKIAPRTRDTAKIFYYIYIGITVLEIVLLMLGGMSLYDSAIHTFGTVATGGFSDKNASMGFYNDNPYLIWVVTIFMLLSGANFSLYFLALKRRWKDALRDRELRFYLSVVLIATALISINLFMNNVFGGNVRDTIRHAAFQVASIITTTGFATTDFDLWPEFSKIILFALFFFGGCAGSTGGSIKQIRMLVTFKVLKRDLYQTLHPSSVLPIRINNKVYSESTVSVNKSFVLLYLLLFGLGSILVALEGVDIMTATTATAVTLGNIGPGLSKVGPVCNYSFFSDATKLLLSFLMIIGRLELFTVITLLFPSFWKD
jgi:trk system potassium uptake protein TrkH